MSYIPSNQSPSSPEHHLPEARQSDRWIQIAIVVATIAASALAYAVSGWIAALAAAIVGTSALLLSGAGLCIKHTSEITQRILQTAHPI